MGSNSKRGSLGRCFNCFFIGNTVVDSRVFSGVTLATDPHSDAGDFDEAVRDVHLTVRAAGAHRRHRRPSRTASRLSRQKHAPQTALISRSIGLAACRTSSMTPALAWRTASSFAPISTASMPRFHDCRAKKFQGMRLFVMVNTARKSHSTILNVRT